MAKYKITTAQEVSLLGENGQLRKIMRVHIVTERGTPGSEDIELADWEPEKIKELLAAKADTLDLAFNLV